MKTLNDFDLSGKTILLRTDLNSEVNKGKITFSERIKKSVQTIKELKKRQAKVVVMSHQGRPKETDLMSLKQHAQYINKKEKITFINDTIEKKAINAIKNLKSGQAILLENIRKEPDEFKPEKGKSNLLIKNLVPLIDIYVNDAFSVCHRNQTSVVLFPKYLPSCAGPLLVEELSHLKKIQFNDSMFILGGAKPEDNIKLLKGKKILSCGYFCHLVLIAKRYQLGEQEKFLKKELPHCEELIKEIKKNLHNIKTPVDLAILEKGKRKELPLECFPSTKRIFDIGSATIKNYTEEIKKAKSIFFKGPSGLYSDLRFRKGTAGILRAVADAKAFSLIGGGHSNEAIKKCKIDKKKFGYVSLSGGAVISYIAGEKLPGLVALESQ